MREVIITPRAQRQMRTALEWWLEHREKAPHAFNEDIERGLLTIAQQPLLGTRIPERAGVRRLFLRRIGYSNLLPHRDHRPHRSACRVAPLSRRRSASLTKRFA